MSEPKNPKDLKEKSAINSADELFVSSFDLHANNRRRFLQGMSALSILAMPGLSFSADKLPTDKVNTTKLAVTDTEVIVGQLHSSTGTMAISETGDRKSTRLNSSH